MSFSDSPRKPRAPRKARPRISLKMQAIGFLSRREHSRQELRAKLLDSLRKRAREDASLAAATEKAARELAEALSAQPSNGIDDAFAPSLPAPASEPARAGGGRGRASPRGTRDAPSRGRERRAGAGAGEGEGEGEGTPASGVPGATRHSQPDRSALETLSLANGAPLPAALRAALASAAALDTPGAATLSPASRAAPAPSPVAASDVRRATSRTRMPESSDEFIDVDGDAFDLANDDSPASSFAPLAATDLELADPEVAVDELLDWLVANKYLSETRFVESRVNARSRKQGTLLIKLELSRHGLALEPEQAATLRETEFARAQALWQRRFGEVATDPRLRAKQARFLAARGFAADVVRRVVGGRDDE